jgi:hypothetical protein
MPRGLTHFLERDHAALSSALRKSRAPGGGVDLRAFDGFRHQLLRHIAIEERVLMPALVAALGQPPLFRNGLRKDHAGIAALCIPTPCLEWLQDLGELLEYHHHVEEGAGGFYDLLDAHLTDEATVRAAIAALPPLRLPPFESGRRVRVLLRQVLAQTGVTAGP